MIILGFIIIIGILMAAFPEGMWNLNHGWRYKDAEPTETSIWATRVGGIFTAVIAAIFLFF